VDEDIVVNRKKSTYIIKLSNTSDIIKHYLI